MNIKPRERQRKRT